MRTKTLGLTVLLLGAVLRPAAQQPPPRPAAPSAEQRPADQQPPLTFKVEVNYVELDTIVTDAQGGFVRGLTKDDFQVLEEGKPQSISICSLVDIPVERTDAPLFSPAAIEPDVRSNRAEFTGRVFVIVLDDLNTHFMRSLRVRAAAKQFIERYLGANDLAAVVTTGGSRGGAQEFTSSKRLLQRAVDAFSGQKARSATLEKLDDAAIQRQMGTGNPPRDLSEPERAFKARNTLSTLRNVADFMAGIRGRRKAVVFFSEGIDYDTTNPIQNRYASDIREEVQDAIAAATRGNVSFYSVDPRGLGGLSDEMMQIQSLPEDNSLGPTSLDSELRLSHDSLRVISDETGGFAAINQNDLRTAFGRIIADNSSYYVLGYYSTDTRRDGRFRSVQVRVTRPGLQVRARKGYTAPKGRESTRSAIANPKISAALRDALDSPLPVTGLGVSVFAAPLKGAAPNASVIIALEIEPGRLKFKESNGTFTDDVEMAVIAVDDSAKVKDGGHDVVNLRLQKTYQLVVREGVRLMRRLEVPPGRYQLRVGVRESNGGSLGTVSYDIDVPDFSKTNLTMSGILLTSGAASRIPTANPDPDLKDVMPAAPTTMREFVRGDTLALFTEVYDNYTAAAHRVAIQTSVLAEGGKAVFTAADERRSEELGGRKGGYGYSASIPLADLAPGRYVLRVEARALLSNGATATRELEFRIR